MNIEEIRKNAPEGATHYDKTKYYFKKTNEGYFVYSKLGWGWSENPWKFSDTQIALYGIKPL